MNLFALANQKGGVAKTTTTLSLGASLARAGQRILLIDLDPQANLTLGVGLEPADQRPTVYEMLCGEVDIAEAIVATSWPSLSIIPADLALAGAERRLYGELGFDEILLRQRDGLEDRFDFVLCDCPPSLGLLTLNALTAAGGVIVPVQCEFFSARGLTQLLEVVALVRRRRNPSLRLRILPTLYDPRNRICRRVHEELTERFTNECFQTTLGLDTKIRDSHAAGVPITWFAPKSRASKQYAALAAEVLNDVQQKTPRRAA